MRAVSLALVLWLAATTVPAATYVTPPGDIEVVGHLQQVTAEATQSLADLAVLHRIGQQALQRANPDLPRWLPLQFATVTLPTRQVLPNAPRRGIVVNLPERRLFHFLEAQDERDMSRLAVYAISVGRVAWGTPLGEMQVVRRREDPAWYPPASIREEAARRGQVLPRVVPPGPRNPLGDRALYLDRPGYLLHGTNAPGAIGLRVTHGCIRLYPNDMRELFDTVEVGTPVRVVDQPLKLGWFGGRLYVEIHEPLEEAALTDRDLLNRFFEQLDRITPERSALSVDVSALRRAITERSGLPVDIGGR